MGQTDQARDIWDLRSPLFQRELLSHMKRLGASYSKEESESFMAVWRYVGHLMGIPETILFRDEAEANRLFENRQNVRTGSGSRIDLDGEFARQLRAAYLAR